MPAAESLVRVELLVAGEEDLLRLGVGRVDRDAVPDRAGFDALGFVERSDALRAALLRDQIDVVAGGNCLVRAGRLAVSAIDAGFRDHHRHGGLLLSEPESRMPRFPAE